MTAQSTCLETAPPPAFEVRFAQTREEMAEIVAIRAHVFRDEQHIVDEELSDPDDRGAHQAYVVLDARMVSIARLAPPTVARPEGQIAWVATLPEYRRRGAAEAAVRALLDVADRERMPNVVLSAQVHALAFYRRLGFSAFGRRFFVRGIEHQHMERPLPRPGIDAR